MRTSLRLVHYEDILDPRDIYSLIALTSFYNKVGSGCDTRHALSGRPLAALTALPPSPRRLQYYGQCSRAFIRLESMEGLSPAEREAYADLALQIFVQHPPVDPTTRSHGCPHRSCRGNVKDW